MKFPQLTGLRGIDNITDNATRFKYMLCFSDFHNSIVTFHFWFYALNINLQQDNEKCKTNVIGSAFISDIRNHTVYLIA